MTQPASAAPARRSGLFVTSVALLVVSLLLTLVAAVGMARVAADLFGGFRSPVIEVPGQAALQLREGSWSIMQRADGRAVQIEPGQIEVVGPGGAVAVTAVTTTETLDRNGVVFQAVARFEATEPGVYGIRIAESEPSAILLAPSLVPAFVAGALWSVLFGVALLAGLAGVALLVVARHRRAAEAPSASAVTASR